MAKGVRGVKIRNGGRWTQGEVNTAVRAALRGITKTMKISQDVAKDARIRRGLYRCAGCNRAIPASEESFLKSGKRKFDRKGRPARKKAFAIDHIYPVVDPAVGFNGWDVYIERLICPDENYQLLCNPCHDKKTNEEKRISAERRKKEKEL